MNSVTVRLSKPVFDRLQRAARRSRRSVDEFASEFCTTLATGTRELEPMQLNLADRAATMRTQNVGTPLWMAPEVLAGRKYGPSADVYSFGIVMWEIAARCQPWSDVRESFLLDALLKRIMADQRPAVDSAWPHSYVVVMRECWATEPQTRPAFAEIVALLEWEPCTP